MRKSLFVLMLAILAIPAWAQTTSVTAQVTDSQGVVWANAHCQVTWIGTGTPSTDTGQTVNTTPACSVNSSGVFSATVTDVAHIVPVNTTTWQFCASPNLSQPFNFDCTYVPVTGSSQDISNQLQAVLVPPSVTGGPSATAYADSQVKPISGNSYFRVSDNTFRCYTTAWGACNSGGTGTVNPGQLALAQYPTSTASSVSPANFTYDAATGNNLTVPGTVTGQHVGSANTCYGQTYAVASAVTQYNLVALGATGVSPSGTGGGPVRGVAQATATSGNVNVCYSGLSSVVMDGTTVAGDIAVPSTTTGGEAHDSGQTSSANIYVNTGDLGIAVTGCTGSPCTAVVALKGSDQFGRFSGVSGGTNVPTIDARAVTTLALDGATDNGPAIQVAWNTLGTSGGRIVFPCGKTAATACYWANPTTFNWGATQLTGATTIELQGYWKLGTTLTYPNGMTAINLVGKSGTTGVGFQVGGEWSTMYMGPTSGVSNGTISAQIVPQYFGAGSPTSSLPVPCNTSNPANVGTTYQDDLNTSSTLWTCTVTTGSITATTNSLTVSNAGGFVRGDKITVAGAGAAGGTLTTYITSISGTTYTLLANAATTVSGAAINLASTYHDYNITPTNGWVPGMVATVTPSSMTNIYAGLSVTAQNQSTALGIADSTFCDISTVTRTSNLVTATYSATTGSITSGSTTLTIAGGTFSNGANIWVWGAGAGSSYYLKTYVVSGGGTTTLTLAAPAGTTVTSQPVVETCHIPPGVGIRVAGVADSTFNGSFTGSTTTWTMTNADYALNLSTWNQTSAANASSTGGTVSGFFEDTPEVVLVGDTASTTFTARFYRPHLQGTQYTLVTHFNNSNTAAGSYKDIVFKGYIPLDINQAYQWKFDNIGAISNNQACNSYASIVLPNWAVEVGPASFDHYINGVIQSACMPFSLQMNQYFALGYGGPGPIDFDRTWFTGAGVKASHGGSGVRVENGVCEQCARAVVSEDNSIFWSGVNPTVELDEVGFQDNTQGFFTCGVQSLYPDVTMQVTVTNTTGCPYNEYVMGPRSALNLQSGTQQYGNYNRVGTNGVGSGIKLDAEVSGAGASMSPQTVPIKFGNVTTSPASWTVSSPCSLASSAALDPNLGYTAGALTGISGGNVNVFTQTGLTPTAYDYFFFGGYVYTPTPGVKAASGGSGTAFLVDTDGSSHFRIGYPLGSFIPSGTNGGQLGSNSWDSLIVGDRYHRVVALGQVVQSDGTASQSMRFYLNCDQAKTMIYWQPFFGYVAAVSTTATFNGTTAVTVASGTGIHDGLVLYGAGVPPNTYVVSGGGTTSLTVNNVIASASGVTVYFQYPLSEILRAREQIINGQIQPGAQPGILYANYPLDLQTNSITTELPNNTASGATLNAIAVEASVGGVAKAQTATTATVMWSGIVVGGATGSTAGNAILARLGQALCIFDGSTTIGDYVQISSTVAGDCHDSGSSTYPTSGATLGIVLTANGGTGTTANVHLYSPGILTSAAPLATNSSAGLAQCDGTTINCSGGVISTITSQVPPWLTALGTGIDGANTTASGNLTGEYWYTNFTVPFGNTVSTNAQSIVIHATGTCTIAGTINLQSANGTGLCGAAGGGSGGGTAAGTAGGNSVWSYASGSSGNGGTAGAITGGNGANATNLGSVGVNAVPKACVMGGAGVDGFTCGGAQGKAGGSSGGAAGVGTGGLTLICNQIVGTDGTHIGIINSGGGNGTPAAANSTGSGSGGGGAPVVLSSLKTVTSWPNIYFSGGPGALSNAVAQPGALLVNDTCSSPAKVSLTTFAGELTACTVQQAGTQCSGLGTFTQVGTGGGTGGTITPTWQSATPTGTFASGSLTVTVSSATGIVLGMGVTGTGIPTGAYVAKLSGTTVTLNNYTTASGSGASLTFTGGALQSCTATGGSGYQNNVTYTTSGNGGDGGAGWFYLLANGSVVLTDVH